MQPHHPFVQQLLVQRHNIRKNLLKIFQKRFEACNFEPSLLDEAFLQQCEILRKFDTKYQNYICQFYQQKQIIDNYLLGIRRKRLQKQHENNLLKYKNKNNNINNNNSNNDEKDNKNSTSQHEQLFTQMTKCGMATPYTFAPKYRKVIDVFELEQKLCAIGQRLETQYVKRSDPRMNQCFEDITRTKDGWRCTICNKAYSDGQAFRTHTLYDHHEQVSKLPLHLKVPKLATDQKYASIILEDILGLSMLDGEVFDSGHHTDIQLFFQYLDGPLRKRILECNEPAHYLFPKNWEDLVTVSRISEKNKESKINMGIFHCPFIITGLGDFESNLVIYEMLSLLVNASKMDYFTQIAKEITNLSYVNHEKHFFNPNDENPTVLYTSPAFTNLNAKKNNKTTVMDDNTIVNKLLSNNNNANLIESHVLDLSFDARFDENNIVSIKCLPKDKRNHCYFVNMNTATIATLDKNKMHNKHVTMLMHENVDLNNLEKDTNYGRYKCRAPNCSLFFNSCSDDEDHYKSLHGPFPYCCRESGCGAERGTQDQYRKHKITHTDRFRCPKCNRGFNHIEREENPFKICKECGEPVARASFPGHMNGHRALALTHSAPRFPYQCDQCPTRCSSVVSLNQHKQLHNNQRKFVCKKCGKRFQNISNLKVHLETHLPIAQRKKYACGNCGKEFLSKASAKNCQKRDSGKREIYTCPPRVSCYVV